MAGAAELAVAAGVGIATIVRSEAGGYVPHGPTIQKIAAALGVEIKDLIEPAEIVRAEPHRDVRLLVVGGPSGSGLERPRSLMELAEELGVAERVSFLIADFSGDALIRFLPPHDGQDPGDDAALATVPLGVRDADERMANLIIDAAGGRS